MNTYLTIITTVLVITQIIRLVQNTISLKRQNRLIKKQIEGLHNITNEDMENQRRFYELGLRWVESEVKRHENH